MNKSKRVIIISVIVVLLIAIIVYFFSSYKNANVIINKESQPGNGLLKDSNVNNGLETSLSSVNFVKDLPKSALISLVLVGNKTTEYIVKKGSVTQGQAKNPDIIITIPSYYADKLKANTCGALSEAKNNGDISVKLMKSKLSLYFKYSGMYKYRSCIGI